MALLARDTPRELPDFQFSDVSGNDLSLSRFRGRFILINVWATWCLPCKEEMASLDRLASQVSGQDLTILPISIDVSRAAGVLGFYKRLGLKNLSIYIDPSKRVMDALSVTGIPTTILIDREGREISRIGWAGTMGCARKREAHFGNCCAVSQRPARMSLPRRSSARGLSSCAFSQRPGRGTTVIL